MLDGGDDGTIKKLMVEVRRGWLWRKGCTIWLGGGDGTACSNAVVCGDEGAAKGRINGVTVITRWVQGCDGGEEGDPCADVIPNAAKTTII